MNREGSFAEKIHTYVAMIPFGRVMTYGQLAALAGSPRAARQVGGVAHYGPEGLPWQRVVNKHGGMAAGFPGGPSAQAEMLVAEGVTLNAQQCLDIERLIWWPPEDSD
ncbi:MGMT family protein [Candidatus Saccharibacteria bacterium]|nr:MGMT family protein [Candidatus Saccharibacteria bacterium]